MALLNGRRYYLRVELPHGSTTPTNYVNLYSNFQVAPAAQLYKLMSVGTDCCSSGLICKHGKRIELFL